jgi:hypothetical protein
MTAIEYLDRPPTGWFALDLMQRKARSLDWVALMVDYDPDDYDPGDPNYIGPPPNAHDAWVRIPGKHRNRDAAWDALEDLIATRH